MIRIMLVDDNRIALQYFSGLVDWETLGYELVCTAIDGESGLIQFQKYRPEVIITDVQMPNLDGIGMAEEIMRLAPETIIVFLSSYEEFSYIRSAMKLGVADYILKHETKAHQMAEKLRMIRRTLEKNRQERRYVAEAYLKNLLMGGSTPEDDERVRNIYLSYFSGKYDMTLINCLAPYSVIKEYFGCYAKVPQADEVKQVLYKDTGCICVIEVASGVYVLLSRPGEVSETEHRKRELETYCKASFNYLLLCEEMPIEACYQMYLRKQRYFDQLFFYSPSSVVRLNALKQESIKRMYTEKDLEKLFRKEDKLALIHKIEQFFWKSISDQDTEGYRQLVCACMRYLCSFEGKLVDYETGSIFHVCEEDAETSWTNAIPLFYWLKDRMTYLLKVQRENTEKAYSGIVQKVILYIYGNYGDCELTAEQIAEELEISINQLNIIVKKETGNTVWKLLIQVRMEMAKRLLDKTDQKIRDISGKVGYSSVAYFSTVFRKYYQISPQEYRKG